MGLFEWIGERRNPGNVGTVNFEKPADVQTNVWALGMKTVASVAMIGGIYYLAIQAGMGLKQGVILAIVLAVYSFLGSTLRIEVADDNMGWAGGLFDNPFRYSDDINRFMLFLKIMLMPGYLLGSTFLNWYRIIRQSQTR